MPEEKNVKFLQVREFGDSLYVPLTKHLNSIGVGKNQIVKTFTRDSGEVVLKKPSEDDLKPEKKYPLSY
ncbi:MAG: hypothetical protein KAJ24_04845 [Candidatus Aenigmarchaeota archaeon]|nr:hypothetical protein [Candidatus Aenigmarchaeota archaeon]